MGCRWTRQNTASMETLLHRYGNHLKLDGHYKHSMNIDCIFIRFTGTQGLIFVVDCADRDRIDEARTELHRIINDREMRDAIILIFANKQDLADGKWALVIPIHSKKRHSNSHRDLIAFIRFFHKSVVAMKPLEVQEKLGLTRIRDRNWYVQPSCATSGDGLCEGLTWLTSNHKLWD